MKKAVDKVSLPATTLVIFGISGDLAKRYILPSLASLDAAGKLPKEFKIIGLSRRELKAGDVLEDKTARLAKHLEIVRMDMSNSDDYERLKDQLRRAGQNIFYLSIPPSAVMPILRRISAAGINRGDTKLLLEKPFGYDLESARELTNQIEGCFKEDQIYRIDHFMAKEMAQNISVFLGSNALFRNIWNKDFIESIEITAAEQIGIEGRANFYEQTGALRDILQNHLMNLAALTLMRPCSSLYEFEEMPVRRLEALERLKVVDPNQAVRAQYQGYKVEVGNNNSVIETFVSAVIYSDDPRWQGVPIRLTTGKELDKKHYDIKVNFKKSDHAQTNSLVLKIQPDQGIEIDLWSKKPGLEQELRHLPLTFSYADGEDLPDAYEQVLIDAMRSRTSLFTTGREVLESWRVLQPVLDSWSMNPGDLKTYQTGSSVEQVLAKPDF